MSSGSPTRSTSSPPRIRACASSITPRSTRPSSPAWANFTCGCCSSAGALAGFPIQDVRVTVYDGKHHPVDSKEVAFVSAGRKAFLDALQKASPIVLEPIMRLEITAPASAIGDITGDLATKRARINGNNSLPRQRATLQALVPLAELSEYQSRLKACIDGPGPYTVELSHYDPVPPRKQQELAQAWKPRAEEE